MTAAAPVIDEVRALRRALGNSVYTTPLVRCGAIELALGDAVLFSGPMHGVVAFIVVVIAMVAAEEIAVRIYRRLAG